jgi:MOSC domain-containing protein YiiM
VQSDRRISSVNVGVPTSVRAKSGLSGIDKRPVAGAVRVTVPAAGCSGLDGDSIGDPASHGGPGQAVYAFAREDLDWWQGRLGRSLPSGTFGENLTTSGLDLTSTRLGERWRVGEDLVLAVTGPRIPCATFAVWMHERGWLKAFTDRAHPGAYLRVLTSGWVREGDPIRVVDRPIHEVDVGLAFRALTRAPELLPRLLDAGDDLEPELRALARAGRGYELDPEPDIEEP